MLHERIELLRAVVRRSQQVQAEADDFAKRLKQLVDLERESNELPSKRDRTERRIRKLQREIDDADRRLDELTAATQEHSQRYQEISREYDRAKGAAQAAKQLYDAYLREQQGKVEIDSFDEFDSSSSVESEYLELNQALAEAEVKKDAAYSPYQSAKSDAEQSRTSAG